jgi:type II secretory pathway pseudopilin PulG
VLRIGSHTKGGLFMRRLLVVLAVVGVAAAAAVPAYAASPHFIGTPSLTQQGNSLLITFKAAGLGNAAGADFSLTGTVNVSSRCYTKSGNKPQAANKQETIPVNQQKTFDVRNGQTTGSFTITPLSTLTCPKGQVVVLESVTYDLTLSGEGLTYRFVS